MGTKDGELANVKVVQPGTADLLNSIRVAILQQQIQQIKHGDQMVQACLMTAGAAMGTMAFVGFGIEHPQLSTAINLCAIPVFSIGAIAGFVGLFTPFLSGSKKRIAAIEKQIGQRE